MTLKSKSQIDSWIWKIVTFGYTNSASYKDQFTVCFSLFIGFIDKMKNSEYHQTYTTLMLKVLS